MRSIPSGLKPVVAQALLNLAEQGYVIVGSDGKDYAGLAIERKDLIESTFDAWVQGERR